MRLRRWYWKFLVGSLLFVDSVCGQQAPLARAQDLLKAGKGQDALPILLELHRSAPLDANLCQQIGIAYTQVENLGEAENFYREATRLNPRFWAARKNLATVLWFLDRKEESEREFLVVTKALPADPVPLVALVATGSALGNAQVLQNGVMSNAVPFSVGTPQITSVSPALGSPGTSVTITGASFGSSQGTGTILLGSTNGQVVSWSDTQVVATVASTALTGIARIQQNGIWSNARSFSVPGGTSLTLTPNLLNMVVGDTHTIQALNPAGQPLTGLAWTSSDSTAVTVSSDDPPILNALAAGHVTIAAGGASADVTVSAGTLSLGTVLWSNPGPGGSVSIIVPAVPSPNGVADVFAFSDYGQTVQAITSDGVTAWTANIGSNFGVLADFQGGLVSQRSFLDGDVSDGCEILKWDGLTGVGTTIYGDAYCELFAIHPDGTVFARSHSNPQQIIGVNPITGAQFGLSVSVPPIYTGVLFSPMIIAGDGYAYVTYAYAEPGSDSSHELNHLNLLRISTAGASTEFTIWQQEGCVGR